MVSVFFQEDPTHNPGATDPNWFYYWKAALFPNVQNVTYSSARVYGFAAFAPPYAIEIGDSGNLHYQAAYNHTALFGYARPTVDGKNRIDLFYSVLTHELQHRADFPSLDGAPDADGDRLPDAIDPFPGVINGAGYGEYAASPWVGDWEFRARAVENKVAPAAKDWSFRGKQW